MRKKIILMIVFTIFIPINSNIKIIDQVDLENYKEKIELDHNSSDAIVSLLIDQNNNKSIIKQIKNQDFCEQFLLITDLVASQIGFNAGISVNSVSLVPASIKSKTKKYQNRAATLHSYAFGKNLESLPAFLPDWFSLHQRIIQENSIWQKKYPLKPEMQGLTLKIIESMQFHQGLPALVAFDTFIGNADRSEPNIFYCSELHKFTGIDHAAAFSNNLAELALSRLEELDKRNYFNTCSPSIIHSLRTYTDTLEKLIYMYKPNDIFLQLEKYSSFLESTVGQFKKRLEFHKRIIIQSYNSCLQLITLLNKILNPHKK